MELGKITTISDKMAAVKPRFEIRKFPVSENQVFLHIGTDNGDLVGLMSREPKDGILRFRRKNLKIGAQYLTK
jgi:hypothetical protein